MKNKRIHTLISILISILVSYIMIGYINNEFNVTMWNQVTRVFHVSLIIALIIFVPLIFI